MLPAERRTVLLDYSVLRKFWFFSKNNSSVGSREKERGATPHTGSVRHRVQLHITTGTSLLRQHLAVFCHQKTYLQVDLWVETEVPGLHHRGMEQSWRRPEYGSCSQKKEVDPPSPILLQSCRPSTSPLVISCIYFCWLCLFLMQPLHHRGPPSLCGNLGYDTILSTNLKVRSFTKSCCQFSGINTLMIFSVLPLTFPHKTHLCLISTQT